MTGGKYRQRGHWQLSFVWFLVFSFVLVALGFIIGFHEPHHFNNLLQPALQKIRNLDAQVKGEATWHLALAIFLNNVSVAILLIVLGIVFGVFPAWTMWMNGVVMGVVCFLVVQKTGASVWAVILYALLPHGIFEMAGLLWASALGCQLGFALAGAIGRYIRVRPDLAMRRLGFRNELWRAARQLPVIVILLIVAASIEAYITPHIIAAHLSV